MAALQAFRLHKAEVDHAIAKLTSYADATAKVQHLITRDELRKLIALANRTAPPEPEPRPAA
jgi:hypothetical protein